jgi:hypothetical protein
LIKRERINLSFDFFVDEQRFYFGGEEKGAVEFRIKKRPDTNPVPCDKESFLSLVPYGECELPIQELKAFEPIVFIQMKDYFSIGHGVKAMPAFLKYVSEFQVIKNLAVKDDPAALVFIMHGLLSAFEIYDA